MANTRAGLTKDQTTFFFTNTKQMEMMKETLTQLSLEGIKKVEDLAEFRKDNWKQVTENLKHSRSRMKNLDKVHGNKNPSTIPQTPYLFGVRTQKRLQEASELTRYYITVGRRLTVANTTYATVIRSFTDQWASLKDCKRQTQPMVAKITAELPIMRWVDVFDNFLSRKIGV
eukprot:9829842-Ditylum_brightwellii.AAC.1